MWWGGGWDSCRVCGLYMCCEGSQKGFTSARLGLNSVQKKLFPVLAKIRQHGSTELVMCPLDSCGCMNWAT